MRRRKSSFSFKKYTSGFNKNASDYSCSGDLDWSWALTSNYCAYSLHPNNYAHSSSGLMKYECSNSGK